MKKSIPYLILCFAFLILQGCGSKNTRLSYVDVIENSTLYSSIAKDLVDYLNQEFPRGHTELALDRPFEQEEFSLLFENELREQGYAINPSAKTRLSYTLDILSSGEYYIQLRYDNSSIACMYSEKGKALSAWTKKEGERDAR